MQLPSYTGCIFNLTTGYFSYFYAKEKSAPLIDLHEWMHFGLAQNLSFFEHININGFSTFTNVLIPVYMLLIYKQFIIRWYWKEINIY